MAFPQLDVPCMQQSLDLNEALIFVSVVDAGSMTAAAERLGMQKSTVSRKVAAMEERIGVRLLQRSTRKRVLTDIGEGHYQRCRQIVQAFEEAENILQSHREEPSGQLNIVAPIEVGQLVLAQFIGTFVQCWPRVTVNVELTNRKIDFREEGIDLALRLSPPNDQNLVCRRVWTSELMLVAAPGFQKDQGIRHPSDIQRLNAIRYNSNHDTTGIWTFSRGSESHEYAVKGNLGFNNVTAIREAAIAGAGVALLPRLILEEALQNGKLVQLLPDWTMPERHVYAIYPPRRFMPLALSKLIEELSQRVRH